MSKHWKPAEYSSVSPYLMVRNAPGVIDFLKQVLGATELRRGVKDPAGNVWWISTQMEQ